MTAQGDGGGRIPVLHPHRWYYRTYAVVAEALARYHRTRVEGAPPDGPCVYVAIHGAGYFVLDLVVAGYYLGWRDFFWRRGTRRPLRIVAAESRIEKALPGLPRVKRHFGIIDPSEESCLAALRAGEQLLVTPGGMREAQPTGGGYRLRWDGRYGFARLAVETGSPIVPLAVVGGREAYPGFKVKKLSFWSPVPLPSRLDIVVGDPIPVERAPGRGRDLSLVKPLHALAWQRTQALYDEVVARRRGGA